MFTTYTKNDYVVNWHHRAVCSALDRVVDYLINPRDANGINRLIISMPPQNGKSELASRRLPAYVLGRLPDTPIIATSYGDSLASSINRDVQRIIVSAEYQRLFPGTQLNAQNIRSDASGAYLRNSEIFEVVGRKGYYKSAGIGGGITGKGFRLGIVDDPIKDAEEAESDVFRDKLWEWYTKVFYSRIRKDAVIIVIMTRWHDDDLIGRLLRAQVNNPYADQWHMVRLPAIYDVAPDAVKEPIQYLAHERYERRQVGDVLWADQYPLAFLNTVEAQDPQGFQGLYQQRPIKPGGQRFARHMFTILEAAPNDIVDCVLYFDKAGTKDAGAYTAGVTIGYSPGLRKYIVLLVVRAQLEAFDREKLIKQTMQIVVERWPYAMLFVEQEPASGGKESAQSTVLNMAGYNVGSERASGDKEVRAVPYAVQVQAGNVAIVAAQWNETYLSELELFPRGKYKDQVDASSGAFNRLTLGWETEETVIDYEPVIISPF